MSCLPTTSGLLYIFFEDSILIWNLLSAVQYRKARRSPDSAPGRQPEGKQQAAESKEPLGRHPGGPISPIFRPLPLLLVLLLLLLIMMIIAMIRILIMIMTMMVVIGFFFLTLCSMVSVATFGVHGGCLEGIGARVERHRALVDRHQYRTKAATSCTPEPWNLGMWPKSALYLLGPNYRFSVTFRRARKLCSR